VKALIEATRRRWRRRRMQLFLSTMRPRHGARVLDIGGRPDLWRQVATDLQITLLNLSSEFHRLTMTERATFGLIEGDACYLPNAASGYDLAFSNSVLEHVGSHRRQELFAATIRKASAYWIQVPAPAFPLEVHCQVPFWWLLPSRLRRRLIRHWYRSGKRRIARQMAGTRPITAARLRALFPDGRLLEERWFGLPKSYYVYFRHAPTDDSPPPVLSGR
jgi:hypothetical protein